MEKDELFDFEFDKDEDCYNVTAYYGRSEEVIFPESYEGKLVKTIGDRFLCNKRIKRVTIPEGYTSIGERVFRECTKLTEINLPKSLTSIGDWAFDGCTELTEIKFPESITTVGDAAFCDCTGLTNIKLPEGLTSIGEWTFRGCIGLTEINLPKNLTSIGDSVFEDCVGLTEINLPENLTFIGDSAFCCCAGLTNIRLPESIISIGESAFSGCTGLTEITVDKNNPVFCSLDGVLFDKAMTTLILFPAGKKGKYAVPNGIIRISFNAFKNCGKLSGISFPQSLLYIDSFRFNCEQLTDITVSGLNPYYCSVDGVLFDKGMCTLMEYPINRGQTNYAVPDGIERIDRYAFYECKQLINIVLPESLEFIGDNAFSGCEGLKAVTLPMNLQYIGERVFENCPNLKTITLSRKTRIGYRAFEGFGQLVYRD